MSTCLSRVKSLGVTIIDMAAEEEAELVETSELRLLILILVKEVKTQQTQDVKVANKDDNLGVADYTNEATTEVHETTVKSSNMEDTSMGCAGDMAYAIISSYITPLVVATGEPDPNQRERVWTGAMH